MVVGEKNSQMQPTRVVKGDQNGYRLTGGVAGSLCPEVINTVDWPFRLGGWATGRQPVTVKKLLGNPNCGL